MEVLVLVNIEDADIPIPNGEEFSKWMDSIRIKYPAATLLVTGNYPQNLMKMMLEGGRVEQQFGYTTKEKMSGKDPRVQCRAMIRQSSERL